MKTLSIILIVTSLTKLMLVFVPENGQRTVKNAKNIAMNDRQVRHSLQPTKKRSYSVTVVFSNTCIIENDCPSMYYIFYVNTYIHDAYIIIIKVILVHTSL